MSTIGELVENIYKYGNCNFYVQLPNPKGVQGLSFLVNENGDLEVSKILEEYDKPFWDGYQKRKNINLKKSYEVLKYQEKDFDIVISPVVSASFYEVRKAITYEDVSPKANTDKAVRKLYEIVYAMFQLSFADLTRWQLMSIDGSEIQFAVKSLQNIDIEEVSCEQAIRNIEVMRQEILDKAKYVKSVYKKTNVIESDEEYKNACEQWHKLYDNHEILKFTFPQKKLK